MEQHECTEVNAPEVGVTPDGMPWSGFRPAAEAAVRQLNRGVPGMDLWLATQVVDDRQLVIAGAGAWTQLAAPGTSLSWAASLCAEMMRGGPPVAASFAELPAYQRLAVGPLAKVRAYLGVPLRRGDGELFGTLCAFAGSARPPAITEQFPTVELVGRLLSSILAGEQAAYERSQEAAQAYAQARRDPLTGLRNRRGWEEALALEEERCARYGTRASIVLVRMERAQPPAVEVSAQEAELHGYLVGGDQDVSDDVEELSSSPSEGITRAFAGVVEAVCPPCDVLGRVERDEIAVLSVETDVVAARELARRIGTRLRALDLSASVGVASRRDGERLSRTFDRAVERTPPAPLRSAPQPRSSASTFGT